MWLAQDFEPAQMLLLRCLSGKLASDAVWSVHFEDSGQCIRKQQGGACRGEGVAEWGVGRR